MSVPDTVTNFLHAKGIDFRLISHSPSQYSVESAQAAHIPRSRLAKAVLLEDDERFLLAVVPANRRVDGAAIERIFHRRFEIAPEDDVPLLFRDCRPGAVPPIGDAYGVQMVVDDAMTEPPEVYLEAGDHEHLICLDHASFLALIAEAERGPISYPA